MTDESKREYKKIKNKIVLHNIFKCASFSLKLKSTYYF